MRSANHRIGKLQEVKMLQTEKFMKGTAVRAPKAYGPPLITNWWLQTLPDPTAKAEDLLRNTNETVHPCVRYRKLYDTNKRFGVEDYGAYNPEALAGWNWPKVKDTKTSFGKLTYSKKSDTTKTMDESVLGSHEKILLALYDHDDPSKNVWERVIGGK